MIFIPFSIALHSNSFIPVKPQEKSVPHERLGDISVQCQPRIFDHVIYKRLLSYASLFSSGTTGVSPFSMASRSLSDLAHFQRK